MLARINWRLVLRHVIPAIYIPLASFIGFAIVVAITGLGSHPYVTEMGYLIASSSFVLVFANLAARDIAGAPRNVAALATVCWLLVATVGAASGGWLHAPFWLALVAVAIVFSIAASRRIAVGGTLDPLAGWVFQPQPHSVMITSTMMKTRLTSFAPQFLVDDLDRSIAYYRKIGFAFGEPWDGFYAIGRLDGLELHLKEAPKNGADRQWRRDHEHLDAAAGVDGIETFYDHCVANGVTIITPLADTPWGTKDFYIEDPDGYVICFGGLAATG